MSNKTTNASTQPTNVECVKCHKKVAMESAQETPNGYICAECTAKAKTMKNVIYGVVAAAVLCGIGAGVWFYNDKKSYVNAEGFDGAENINDSINIVVDTTSVVFNIATATVTSTPVSAQQKPVSDIEEFQKIYANSITEAKAGKVNQLQLPTLAAMFDFKSAQISSQAQSLISEFANVYGKTSQKSTIVVDGYACNIGGDDANNSISKERAEAVRTALVAVGVPANKIELHWYGKSKNSEFNLATNAEYRRVLLSIR